MDDERYDLIAIGGGIHGVCLAYEASRAGLRPLLIERGEFGRATSWSALGILHGGLRYLQSLDLARFRQSVRERTWFLEQFPELVEPLGFLLPIYGHGIRRRSIIRGVLAVNDALSRSRNDGLSEDCRLADGRMLSREETIELFPDVRRAGLQGAGLWYDGFTQSPHSLLLKVLRRGEELGARFVSGVEANSLLLDDGRVVGVQAYDHNTNQTRSFQSAVVVNCCGPWCRALAGRFDRDVKQLFSRSLAFNLLLDRQPPSCYGLAVSPRTNSNRTLCLVPRGNRLLAGTHHVPLPANGVDDTPSESHIAAFLADLNEAVPALRLTRNDVLDVHAGLVPAVAEGAVRSAHRDIFYDHASHGGPVGLYSVSGVKFTTARSVAELALRRISRRGRGTQFGLGTQFSVKESSGL